MKTPRCPQYTLLTHALALLVAAPAIAAAAAGDANWPQWRGPLANGTAPGANPPTEWSETKNVKWKVKIPGGGHGTPIIWENQVFIQTAIPTGKKIEAAPAKAAFIPQAQFAGTLQAPADPPPPGDRPRRRPGGPGGGGGGGGRGEKPTEIQQFVLMSLDRQTGKTLWQQTAVETVPHEGHHRDHGFASHSPVTDGQHVFGWFGSRGIYSYDLKGKLQWSQDFGDIRSANGFGEGNSIALSGDTLVINWDSENESFILALDKNTGKTRWRKPREERTTWATPLIIEHAGKKQVITSASRKIRSYDLATGDVVWECAGMTANVIPTPVSDFGMVYAISGFRGNALLAIKLGKTGDLTGTDAIAWQHNKSTPYVPSPMLYGDKLWFFSGNNATISCFDAKAGKPLIDAERLEGPSGIYASPVGASGRVYLAGRNGVSVVLKNTGTLEILATNKLDEKFDASPALSGNQLLLRGHEYLYCLAEK